MLTMSWRLLPFDFYFVRGLDRRDQLAGLLERDLRRFALDHRFLDALHRGGRVEHHHMPLHQAVEETPQCGQVQVSLRRRAAQGDEYLPTIPGEMPPARPPPPRTRLRNRRTAD